MNKILLKNKAKFTHGRQKVLKVVSSRSGIDKAFRRLVYSNFEKAISRNLWALSIAVATFADILGATYVSAANLQVQFRQCTCREASRFVTSRALSAASLFLLIPLIGLHLRKAQWQSVFVRSSKLFRHPKYHQKCRRSEFCAGRAGGAITCLAA